MDYILQYLKLTFFFSGNDELLRSSKEAERLCSMLENCRTHHFRDSGHTILMVWLTNSFSFPRYIVCIFMSVLMESGHCHVQFTSIYKVNQ
jgi:hypothetical protein